MSKRMTMLSVRVRPETIKLLNQLHRAHRKAAALRSNPAKTSNPSRSELLRHAITAGLDVLTEQPTLKT